MPEKFGEEMSRRSLWRLVAGLLGAILTVATVGAWAFITFAPALDAILSGDLLLGLLMIPLIGLVFGYCAHLLLELANWLLHQARWIEDHVEDVLFRPIEGLFGPGPTDEAWEAIPSREGMRYEVYLESAEWNARRRYLHQTRGNCCEVCGRSGQTEVHHKTYKRLGHEHPKDLMVVCRSCHETIHRQHG